MELRVGQFHTLSMKVQKLVIVFEQYNKEKKNLVPWKFQIMTMQIISID